MLVERNVLEGAHFEHYSFLRFIDGDPYNRERTARAIKFSFNYITRTRKRLPTGRRSGYVDRIRTCVARERTFNGGMREPRCKYRDAYEFNPLQSIL